MTKFKQIMSMGLMAASMTAGAQEPNCPEYSTPAVADSWFRQARSVRPNATARCLALRAADLPDTGTEAQAWRNYLTMTGAFLQKMHDEAPNGSEAQVLYKKAELATWLRARAWTAQQLGEMPAGPARTKVIAEYNQIVNHVSNAYWRLSLLATHGLQPFHDFMKDLDPVYLFSQTAERWIEAVRTCPGWVPATSRKGVPDYAEFCEASCHFEYRATETKLKSWATGVPDAEKVMFLLKGRSAEVAKYCKE